MKKYFAILFIFVLISQLSNAQKINKKQSFDFKSKPLYVGGNLGLMFGNVTVVDLSPEISIGYSDKFHLGTAFLYTYYREITNYGDFHYSIFGGRVFGRYFFHQQFYLHGEYEKTYYKDPFYQNPTGKKYITTDGLNFGLGYINGDYHESYRYVALLYNVLNDEVNFGINPFFRFGIVICIDK